MNNLYEYTALIVENMLTQVDSDGYSLTVSNAIIELFGKADTFVVTQPGQKRPRKISGGWSLLV
jgi:hypothetical protein